MPKPEDESPSRSRSPEGHSGRELGSRAWVGITANANAGVGRGRDRVARLIAALSQRHLETRVAWTIAERGALLREAASEPGCACLVAAGGDGTISDLANERPGVPVTVLPVGTENLFAQSFRIPRDPEEVARMIARGDRVRMDLGRIQGRDFVLMAGFGFDAEVVSRHHEARLGRQGRVRPTHRAAYVGPVLQASWSYGFPPVMARILDQGSEETLVGTSLFVFNLPRYALGLPFAPEAREDDGWLDLVVFRDPGALRALYYLWRVMWKNHHRLDGVWHRRVRRVELSTSAPSIPVQLDGDPGGVMESVAWTAEVVPAVLDVIVPGAVAEGRRQAP